MKSFSPYWLAQRRVAKVTAGVILVTALVLLFEAVYVMFSGWTFSESILGGRFASRTVGLFIIMLPITTAMLHKYADRYTAFRITFVALVLIFSVLACRFSVEFTW